MNPRTYSLVFLVPSLLVMLAVAGFNYAVDPFTYYHRPWTTINFSGNHRYGNPGLARQFDYRSVLVGTSHVQELESSRLSEIIGEKALNLSISAGVAGEQARLIDLVLRLGKADSILWEMNFPSFSFGQSVDSSGNKFPGYLYTPGLDTPFRYLLSFDTLLQSRSALRDAGRTTLDNRNRIAPREFSERRVLLDWQLRTRRWNRDLRQFWANNQQAVVPPGTLAEILLVPLIAAHPDITFKLFLPPGSVLFYLLHESMGAEDFERWLAWRDKLGELTERFPNVELHDFQADPAVSDNLNLFRDLEHFNRDLLESLFQQISKGTHRVDANAIRLNSQRLRVHVRTYGRDFCAEDSTRCPQVLRERLGL
jgi:hypothetical protein